MGPPHRRVMSGGVADRRETPDVSVIVPVYNDRERLAACLKAIANQSYPKHHLEVIVVDNGSQDRVEDALDDVDLALQFHIERKRGSYAARNTGIRNSNGSVLAFTDADCLPHREWVKEGVDRLLVGDADLVGGKVEVFPADPARPTGFEVVDLLTAFPQKSYVETRDFAVTANMFMSTQVVEAVGTFNNELESGGDMDFGQRAVSAGFELVYEPECVVHHPARSTLDDHRKKIARVTRGKKAKGDIDPKWDWRRWTRLFIPPLIHSVRSVWVEKKLPFKSKMAGACSLIIIHYVKEWEEHKARRPGRSDDR